MVVAFTAGCGSTGIGEPATTQVLTTTSSENPAPTTSTLSTVSTEGETPLELDTVTEAAQADLVARLGIDPTAVEVLVSERVTWPDGRLGCIDLSLPYTLEPVEGYRVVLGYEGQLYHYHVGSDAIPILCESLTERSGGPGTPQPSIPPPVN